jgi:uncharacterized lipoprotein
VTRLLLLALAAAILAGCASDPRYSKGLEWVLENEAEKRRLTDMGFPQYNHAGGS